jgi:hypothetical protein
MTTRATSAFVITGWDETPHERIADGPKLGGVVVKKTFTGDLEGASRAELLTAVSDDGSAGYVAREVVTGRLAGRSGTFVLMHGGLQHGDEQRPFGHVVPGSATGELAGLTGECEFSHDEHGATFTLEYELP